MTESDTAKAPSQDAGILATLRESPVAVKALLAGVFVNRLGTFMQIYLVLFLTERGYSEVQAGFALGWYGAGSVIGVLVGGALADRLGARSSILVSMSGTAAFVLAVLYAPNYVTLVIAVTLFGVIGQMYRPASAALISELTPSHRQVMIFAMHRLALNLGTSAAPLLGAALFAVSYDLLFWGQAAAALGYAVIALIALPRHTPITKATPGVGSDAAATPHGTGYAAVLADKRFLLFLAAFLINSVVYLQHVSALPLAMRDAGLPVIWYGAMITLNAVIVITCELLATKVVQTWQMRTAAAVGFALLGAGMAAYALPGGVAIFVIGTLIWTLAEIVAGPTMFAYPATAAPPGLRGRYIGTSQAVFGIGTAIGPPAGVAIWYGAGDALWVLCGLICLLGIGAVWVGMRPNGPAGSASPEPATSDPATSETPTSAKANAADPDPASTAQVADAANMTEPATDRST